MPGIVQSVDLAKMTCVVTLAIQGVVTDTVTNVETPVTINPLHDVPICFPSAGGFTLTLPMAAGDEVLVVIASRCIDSWWANGGLLNVPMEARMHDLSDGFAIPGPRSQPRVISGISATKAQLRNDAGTVYVEITPAGAVNIVAPAGAGITGNLTVSGTITAAEVIGGGKHLSTHTHPVTTAPGTTGAPN